jgi:hypothetical protein
LILAGTSGHNCLRRGPHASERPGPSELSPPKLARRRAVSAVNTSTAVRSRGVLTELLDEYVAEVVNHQRQGLLLR